MSAAGAGPGARVRNHAEPGRRGSARATIAGWIHRTPLVESPALGAVAIAALLAAKTEAWGPTVVVSGANIDMAAHARLVAGAGAQATCTIPARDVLKPPPAGPNPAPGRAKLRSELN